MSGKLYTGSQCHQLPPAYICSAFSCLFISFLDIRQQHFALTLAMLYELDRELHACERVAKYWALPRGRLYVSSSNLLPLCPTIYHVYRVLVPYLCMCDLNTIFSSKFAARRNYYMSALLVLIMYMNQHTGFVLPLLGQWRPLKPN